MENTMQTIEASHPFNKNVQELYDAWIDTNKLKQWWQPAGNKLVQVENNVTKGGHIRYVFETKNGEKSFVITGEYKEVQPASRLVYTWNWQMPGSDENKENHFELTVEFSGDDNKSQIHVIQKDLDAQESIHPHQSGWQEEMERLAQFLG